MNEEIGVVGGGQMGSRIAALSAMAGYETHIYDKDTENVTSKLKFAEDNLKNLLSKNKFRQCLKYWSNHSRYPQKKLKNWKLQLQQIN